MLRDLAISVVNVVVGGALPGSPAALVAEGIGAAESYAAQSEDPRADAFVDWVRASLTTGGPR